VSPALAFQIVTWVAIIVLFCALAAVMREVRLLRGIVMRNPDGYAAARPDIELGSRFANRIVLAADTGCPLCVASVERLPANAVLLTHEPAEAWASIAGELEIICDREAWRAISHLSTPVLMLVNGSGRVGKLVLPVRVEEVDDNVTEWSTGVADV
jgi:hypothetical protein